MSDRKDPRTPQLSRRAVLGGLAGLATLGAGYAIWRRIPPPYEGGKLSVAQAFDAASGGAVLLVDIRTPREWRQTGLPQGGVPLDMRRKDFIQELTALAGGDTARPIALICARGVRSARLSRQLSAAGFTRIIDVPQGMLGSGAGPGWIASGLPVVPWDGVMS